MSTKIQYIRNKLNRQLLVSVLGKTKYFFRDSFTLPIPADNINNTIAQPGHGLRQVVDTEKMLKISNGQLRGHGQITPVWGEEKIVWTTDLGDGFARVSGRTLLVLFTPEEATSWGDYVIGWASATNITAPKTDGFGLHTMLSEVGGGQGEARIVIPGVNLTGIADGYNNLRAMQYLLAITLNDQGALIMLSTFGTDTGNGRTWFSIPQYPLARLMWVDYDDTTNIFYPSIQFYAGNITDEKYLGHVVESVRIVDFADWAVIDGIAKFSDRFTRNDSTTLLDNNWTAASGTWGILTNRAYLPTPGTTGIKQAFHGTGLINGNGVYQWYITTPDSVVPSFRLLYRYQDTQNYYYIHNNYSRSEIHLGKIVGNSNTTTIAATGSGINWVAGNTFRITAYVEDGNHRIFVNNVLKMTFTTQTDLPNATNMGIGIGSDTSVPDRCGTAGTKFDNIVAWPFQVTLPIDGGKTPGIYTGDVIIAQDSFTDDDDTLLPDHTPEIGPVWERVITDWTIQNNSAFPTKPTLEQISTYCLQDLGIKDVECQVEITTPTDVGSVEYFGGIVGRYVDSNHFIGARLVRSDSLQLNSHEIELFGTNGGDGYVRHKVNLGNFFIANTTYTLKIQWKGSLMHVFLNNAPVISYHMSIADGDSDGTKFGLHDYYLETGCTFNNWIVKTL
jgi:hypothetical protein